MAWCWNSSWSGTSNYYPTLKFVQFHSIWWRETILSWRSFNLTSVALSSRKNYLGKPIIYIRFLVEQTIGPSFSNSIEVFCFPVLGPPYCSRPQDFRIIFCFNFHWEIRISFTSSVQIFWFFLKLTITCLLAFNFSKSHLVSYMSIWKK